MIIDTSALASIVFAEPTAGQIEAVLQQDGPKKMTTVNLAELIMSVEKRMPNALPQMNTLLEKLDIQFVAPDVLLSRFAGRARARFPINLGDCFCYALAIREVDEIFTLDAEFGKTDARVIQL